MSKKKPKKYWVDYLLSFHLGFCHGPVDELVAVKMKERDILDNPMSGNGAVVIDKPDLFGGNEREGGAMGLLTFMNGNEEQVAPQALASRVGKTPSTMPGFRQIASLLFTGTGNEGFTVASNYPNVPDVWARFRRRSRGLNAPGAIIENDKGYRDSNPAHMIWECIVNTEWGMGALPQQLDYPSFVAAAATLADEKFGLSMIWTRQMTIEAFIQEILNHINALLFFNPLTGLLQIKLLRNDYDINTLPQVGPNQASLVTFRRKLWGETINEIVVSWTNPETEEQETLTYQDLGNIAMQGSVVSENRNYYGIRSATLASQVGARDIVSEASPRATATITAKRSLWNYLPGDVVLFTWPRYDIGQIVMRVMEVDYGTPTDSKIKINLIEDVWGLNHAEYLDPPETEWEDPARDPNQPNLNLGAKFLAVPYSWIQMNVGEEHISDDMYPDIIIAALVSPTKDQKDIMSFVLHGEEVMLNGETVWASAGEKNTVGRATLKDPLSQEATSVIYIEDVTGGPGPEVGEFAIIGSGEERDSEIVLIDANLGDGNWRVWRGVLDTVPHDWSSGDTIWFIGSTFNAYDGNVRPANTQVSYKIQPRTSKGLRDLSLCPELTTVRPDRPYRPYRPANVKVNLVPFYLSDESTDYGLRHWTMDVSWSNRHRKMEDSIIRRWDEGDVAPEEGQTTEVILMDSSEKEIYRWTGLEGTRTTLQIPVELSGQIENFKIKVVSRRDGFESLQGLTIDLRLYRKGYGSDYGYFYGGWPEETEFGNA